MPSKSQKPLVLLFFASNGNLRDMILTPGSSDALSFTDDTSLPNAGVRVSIDAQILRGHSLDWFYRLLLRLPDDGSGELKSGIAAKVFFTIPEYERRAVLQTLKHVRIHVTDPRPYTYDVDDVLSEIIREDVAVFIDRLDKARRQVAERERRKMIARRMLRDAPPHRITSMYLAYEYAKGLRIRNNPHLPPVDDELSPYPERQETPKDFDFTSFERGNKNMVNVLSGFLSKSQSVFSETVDGIESTIEGGDCPVSLFGLLSKLSGSHAFDKGDTQKIHWIDTQRRDVMARIDWRKMYPVQPGQLYELDSKESFCVQAADFAGRYRKRTLGSH